MHVAKSGRTRESNQAVRGEKSGRTRSRRIERDNETKPTAALRDYLGAAFWGEMEKKPNQAKPSPTW
jgi:hypothetical protein